MIELIILAVRHFILKPLGLVKEEVDENKVQRDWLKNIGYYDKEK